MYRWVREKRERNDRLNHTYSSLLFLKLLAADYPYAKKAAKQVENGTAAAALFAGTKPENIMFGS
jgi:hypothetical protein